MVKPDPSSDSPASASGSVPLNGLVNLRDLGDLPADEGKVTKRGMVYRSDAPYDGDRSPDVVQVWPPHHVVDLRDPREWGAAEHALSEVSNVHRLPLLEDLRVGQEQGAPRLSLHGLYQYLLTEVPKKLVEIFRIAVGSEGPVLIHCAAGKDRTGVASALLLAAAGVRPDAIIADYVHTDQNMMRVLRRLGAEPDNTPGVDQEAVRELVSAPADAMHGVLEHFDRYTDGAAGWLLAHGGTEPEIQQWRERFVTNVS